MVFCIRQRPFHERSVTNYQEPKYKLKLKLTSPCLTRQERTNLVSKGSVPVLYGLSSDEDLTTLHYVACTLVRLGMEEQGHARMIQEGAAR